MLNTNIAETINVTHQKRLFKLEVDFCEEVLISGMTYSYSSDPSYSFIVVSDFCSKSFIN